MTKPEFTLEELQHLNEAIQATHYQHCPLCDSCAKKLEQMITEMKEKPVKETREIGGHTVTVESSRS